MTKLYAVRSYVRRAPSRPASYTAKHRALIDDVRRHPEMRATLSRRRARAAQARFDAAMEQMAGELNEVLEQEMTRDR